MTIGKPEYWVQFRIAPLENDWERCARHRSLWKAKDTLHRLRADAASQRALSYRLIKVQEVR